MTKHHHFLIQKKQGIARIRNEYIKIVRKKQPFFET